MAYFKPYFDEQGIHMPTYEERLDYLLEEYRNIFGEECELSEAVTDYQFMSVFSKALDDLSGLALKAYNARSPYYATGSDLDALLPLYGLSRETGESDADLRSRVFDSGIFSFLHEGGPEFMSQHRILKALSKTKKVRDAKVYENPSNATDGKGIPPHSICVVTRGGSANAIAQAIYDSKPPGCGTYAPDVSPYVNQGIAYDTSGRPVTVYFRRYSDKIAYLYIFAHAFNASDQGAIEAAVIPAVVQYVNHRGIGNSLDVPGLYSVIMNADPDLSDKFYIKDIQCAIPGAPTIDRGRITPEWYESFTVIEEGGVEFRWS